MKDYFPTLILAAVFGLILWKLWPQLSAKPTDSLSINDLATAIAAANAKAAKDAEAKEKAEAEKKKADEAKKK